MGADFPRRRAGLINERCASHVFHTHPTRRFGIAVDMDARFKDACSIMDGSRKPPVAWLPAKRLANRFKVSRRDVAHRAYQELAFYRREGAGLVGVVRHLWNWRRLLARCTFIDFVAASRLRLIGRILSPTPLIRLVHLLEAR